MSLMFLGPIDPRAHFKSPTIETWIIGQQWSMAVAIIIVVVLEAAPTVFWPEV